MLLGVLIRGVGTVARACPLGAIDDVGLNNNAAAASGVEPSPPSATLAASSTDRVDFEIILGALMAVVGGGQLSAWSRVANWARLPN